jgi:hypothetical protein
MSNKIRAAQIEDVCDDPKRALIAYISDLENRYLRRYEKAKNRNYIIWSIAQGTAVVAGLVTAFIAAVINDTAFKTFSSLRTLLILTPLIGTFASSVLLQTRIRDLFALRERGRQAFQLITTSARAEFAAAQTSDRYTEIHRDLAERVRRVEAEQAISFFDIVPEVGLQQSKKDGHLVIPAKEHIRDEEK